MPRHRRIDIPGAVYHVIARGLERREIFKDDQDRKEFLRRLSEGLKQTGCKCYGWVLMPNHFHLLIRTGTKSLSELMRKLLTGYAVYFNTRYERSGYLYQNRYKSILCQEDNYLLELVRYIHLNPLRARLVKDISELNEYKWSGHQALLGAAIHVFQTTGEILEHFDSNRTEAVKKYLAFIDEAKDTGKRRDLSGGGLKRSLAGWDSIKELKENWRGDERLLGDVDFVNEVLKISEENLKKKEKLKKDGWDINRVIKLSCNLMGIDEANILKFSRKDKASQARSLAAFWLNRDLGINMAEIGRYFGITKQSVSGAVRRGERLAEKSGYKLTN